MGHIRKREDRDGYLARYRGPDGRERAKSFRRKADALRFLATVEADGPSGHLELLAFRLYDPRAHQWNISFATRDSAGVLVADRVLVGKDGVVPPM